MSNIKIIIIVLFLIITFLSPLIILSLPPRLSYYSNFEKVNKMILLIEDYYKINNKYPANDWFRKTLDDDTYYYEVLQNGYIVGFTIGFDENYYFDSRNNTGWVCFWNSIFGISKRCGCFK
jgi:hypothetical protein